MPDWDATTEALNSLYKLYIAFWEVHKPKEVQECPALMKELQSLNKQAIAIHNQRIDILLRKRYEENNFSQN